MNISFFFTFSPQDGMVQFGKAKVSPQFQVGPIAHPSVVTGLPVKRWDSFWVSGKLCYQVLPPHPHPHPHPALLSHYHSRCIPCSCCLGIRLVSAGWQPFFICFWHLVLKPGGWEGLCLSPIPCLSLSPSLPLSVFLSVSRVGLIATTLGMTKYYTVN